MPRRLCSPLPENMSNESRNGGIEVNIVDFEDGMRLAQVHVSKTNLYDQIRANRYVVFAIADRRFAIKVTAHTTFDWGEANGLAVTISFDAGSIINQKSVYLVKPPQGRGANSCITGRALLEMSPSTQGHSRRIDQILIQEPNEPVGRVLPYGLVFGEPSEDAIVNGPGQSRKVTEKVSEHQGKIRIEVGRVIVKKGTERYAGLYDHSENTGKPSRAALLDNGLTLELRLDKVAESGLLDYGSAFRPSTCKRTEHRTIYNFEFLYRSADVLHEIVHPQFLNEVSDHPHFRACLERRQAQAAYPEFTCGPQDDITTHEEESSLTLVEGSSTMELYENTKQSSSPSRHLDLSDSPFTTVSLPPNDVDLAGMSEPVRRLQRAVMDFANQSKVQENKDEKSLLHIQSEFARLRNLESKVDSIVYDLQDRLEQSTHQFEQHVREYKDRLTAMQVQIEQRRKAQNGHVADAVDRFCVFLGRASEPGSVGHDPTPLPHRSLGRDAL